MEPGNTLAEFWPFYLQEHQNKANVALHAIGTTVTLALAIIAVLGIYWLLALAFVCGYAFAWVGHFLLEKNRPATFRYPIRSFLSDWKLWGYTVTGKIGKEMQKHGFWK